MKLSQTAGKLKVSPQLLRYWRQIGLLNHPSSLKGDFSFIDLIQARFILRCRQKGISLQSLRQAVSKQNKDSWHQNLTLHNEKWLLERHQNHFFQLSDGQMVFPFSQKGNELADNAQTRGIKQGNGKETGKKAKCHTSGQKRLIYMNQNKRVVLRRLEEKYSVSLEEDNLTASENILLKIRSLAPEHTAAWVELGNIYFEKRELQKAQKCYEHSLELEPECSKSLYNLANLHFQKKQFAVAIRYYHKCLNINPMLHEAYHNLGMLFSQIGLYPEALYYLEVYLSLMPSSELNNGIEQLVEDIYAKYMNEENKKKNLLPFPQTSLIL